MTSVPNPETQMLDLLKRIGDLPMMAPPSASPLSMPQVALLNWVAREPGCGVLSMAERLHVTPPTVSVAVRRLVEDGWLEQRNDPHDRRARPLFLTEKGASFVEIIHVHRNKMIQTFLSGLSPEEQEQLVCLLDRAIRALETKEVDI